MNKGNNDLQYKKQNDRLNRNRLSASYMLNQNKKQLQQSEEYQHQIMKKSLLYSTIAKFNELQQVDNSGIDINVNSIRTEFNNIWSGKRLSNLSPAGKLTIFLLITSVGLSVVNTAPIPQRTKELLEGKVPGKVADNFAEAMKNIPNDEAEYMLSKMKESVIGYDKTAPYAMNIHTQSRLALQSAFNIGGQSISPSKIRHENMHYTQHHEWAKGNYHPDSNANILISNLRQIKDNLGNILSQFSADQIDEITSSTVEKYSDCNNTNNVNNSPFCHQLSQAIFDRTKGQASSVQDMLDVVLDVYIQHIENLNLEQQNVAEEIVPYLINFLPSTFVYYIEQTSYKEDLQPLIDKVRITETLHSNAIKLHSERLEQKRHKNEDVEVEL